MKNKLQNNTAYRKILVSYLILFFSMIMTTYIGIRVVLQYELDKNISQELESVTSMAAELVHTTSQLTIVNHLKTEVISVERVIESIYNSGLSRGVTDEQMKKEASDYILNQTIGETGYFYVINSRGDILVHPFFELVGTSVAEYSFVQTQILEKAGYLEYDWKNPDDTKSRPKALYMTQFEPWDWIISASAYKAEFRSLIHIDDVRNSLNKIRIGKNGYLILLDQQGNLLMHPDFEGKKHK